MSKDIVGPIDKVQARNIANSILYAVDRLENETHIDIFLTTQTGLRIVGDVEPTYGWEDPNHEWAFMGNLSVFDVAHGMSIPFGLYRCNNCDALKMGNKKDHEDEYRTPWCDEHEMDDT